MYDLMSGHKFSTNFYRCGIKRRQVNIDIDEI